MKALTICQPFASLIVGGPGIYVGELKRIENRTWRTDFRGKILIHAGKSHKWMPCIYEFDSRPKGMPFGALVGTADLVDCLSLGALDSLLRNRDKTYVSGLDPRDRRFAEHAQWMWCLRNMHAAGPFLWLLEKVRRFEEPVPYPGAQGLFEVPARLVENRSSVEARIGCVDEDARQCRVCGCTQRHGCDLGGESCHWVETDLCSACQADLRRAGP